MTCGATGAFAIGLPATAGAVRVAAARGEAVCSVALIACPEALRMTGKAIAIRKNAKNVNRFIIGFRALNVLNS